MEKMKRMKIIAVAMTALFAIGMLAACGTGDNAGADAGNEADTIGTKLISEFITASADTQDVQELADVLSKSEIFGEVVTGCVPVEEGLLNGFDGEIEGFNSGAMFCPMIGTIPFVGYVFETDDADALIESLEAHAQLNWNICTEADEMVTEKNGNLVCFIMAPESFEE